MKKFFTLLFVGALITHAACAAETNSTPSTPALAAGQTFPLVSGKAVFKSFPAETNSMPALAAGQTAPLISGKDQDGKDWKLADLIGKKIVLLYFYPKDFTGGCTKEACGLRDRMGGLQSNNVHVVGVSFDSSESHKKFIAEHQLNFSLVADTDGKVADAFGARKEGKNISRRVSFLIGLDGKIAHVTDKPSADAHLTEMTEAVGKLTAGRLEQTKTPPPAAK